MAKRPKSEALAAVHETMQDLHSVGAIDDKRMQHFDEKCLVDAGSASTLSFTVYKANGTGACKLTAAEPSRPAVKATRAARLACPVSRS